MKSMYSKFPGTCSRCKAPFPKGTFINIIARGVAAHHSCPCDAPDAQRGNCWECGAEGAKFRNWGAATPMRCDACEAKFRAIDNAKPYNRRDNSSHEDSCCGDLAYEDACAAACGPGL